MKRNLHSNGINDEFRLYFHDVTNRDRPRIIFLFFSGSYKFEEDYHVQQISHANQISKAKEELKNSIHEQTALLWRWIVNSAFRQRAALAVISLAMIAGGFAEALDSRYTIMCISAVFLGFLHALP